MNPIIPPDDIPLKRCPKCPEGQQWHPATPEFFHRYKDGLQSYCKKCIKTYTKEYLKSPVQPPMFYTCSGCHAEKALTEFPVDPSKRNGYRQRCKDCWNAQERTQTNLTREQHKAYERGRRAQKREYYSAYSRQYIKSHPHYRERRRVLAKEWMRRHPLKVQETGARRRVRERQGHARRVSYKHILERDGMHCYICEQDIEPGAKGEAKLSFDHIIPLARGGSHAEDNIKPAHLICNRRKWARLLEEMDAFSRRGLS